MDKLIINGNKKLFGKITVSGSKNAVLPVMAATIIEPGVYTINNVPKLRDTEVTPLIAVVCTEAAAD